MRSAPLLLVFIALFLAFFEATQGANVFNRHKKQSRGGVNERQSETTRLDCWDNEHFVSCGPEAQCEVTCENRHNPPRCRRPQFECNFPRCVCNNGYVRGPNRRCIRPDECTNVRPHSPQAARVDSMPTGRGGGIVENPSRQAYPSSGDIVCQATEKYHSCGKDCEKTCVDILFGKASDACVCVNRRPGCICKDGYAKATDLLACVPHADCSSYVAVEPPASANTETEAALPKAKERPPEEDDESINTGEEPTNEHELKIMEDPTAFAETVQPDNRIYHAEGNNVNKENAAAEPEPEVPAEPADAKEENKENEDGEQEAEPAAVAGDQTDEDESENAAPQSSTIAAEDAGEQLPTDNSKTPEEKVEAKTDERVPTAEPSAEPEPAAAEAESSDLSGTPDEEQNVQPEPSTEAKEEEGDSPTPEETPDNSEAEQSKQESENNIAPAVADNEEGEMKATEAGNDIADSEEAQTASTETAEAATEEQYCPVGQEWMTCGSHCENTCENVVRNENRPIACPLICKSGTCGCSKGYARFAGQCITEEECKLNVEKEPTLDLTCGENERATDCGPLALHCQKSCDPGEVRIHCTRRCGPPACICAEGFVRKSNRRGMPECVPESSCPSYSLNHVVSFVSLARTGHVQPFVGLAGAGRMGNENAHEENTEESDSEDGNSEECGENESLNPCGNQCEAKCSSLQEGGRSCTRICNPPACACKVGFARDANGKCVAKEDCPDVCGANEIFVTCSPPSRACEASCNHKQLMCLTSCGPPRCVCQDGFIRSGPNSNDCVAIEDCSEDATETTEVATQECGSTEEWTTCGPLSKVCEAKCPGLFTSPLCFRCGPPACVCKPNFVKSISGECVPVDSCPYVDSDALLVVPPYPVSQADCGTNEHFVECGPYASHCVSTCFGPGAPCPKMCGEPACVCQPGTVRGPNGDCIDKESCSSESEPTSEPSLECAENEMYVECGPYSKRCELACDDDGPKACPQMCGPPACVCKTGFLRESKTSSSCVTTDSCKSQTLHDKGEACPNNTLFTMCSPSPKCRLTCANPSPGNCVSDRMCRPPSCVCDENNGFVLLNKDSTQCVHHSECLPPAEYDESFVPDHATNRERDCNAPKPDALECFDPASDPNFTPDKEKADLGVRWYYNREKWACVAFNWRMWAYPNLANCSGTPRNMFETRKACEARCQLADGPACSGSDSTKPIKLGRKLRARRVAKPFDPFDTPVAMPEEGDLPLDCHNEGYGCPEGFTCRRGMHFGTCCNATVEAYFADAYKRECPEGEKALGSDMGEYWRPYFGDNCAYGGLVCPSSHKCVEINPLFAKCCQHLPRRKPLAFSGRPVDPDSTCKPDDCEQGCYPIQHPDGCTRCFCPEKAGLPPPSEPVDCGEFTCPGHCPIHRKADGCYECRCVEGDDKLVYWIRVPVKSDSLTIPHLCIDYPVSTEGTDTGKEVALFNISASEWAFESLGGTVQIVERPHRTFLSIPELFHVKRNTEIIKATANNAEVPLSRAKRTDQEPEDGDEKSGRVIGNSIPLDECPCGASDHVEISPWLNWAAFSSYDWAGSDLAHMVKMLESARLEFDTLTGRNMPAEAELVLTNPFNKNERELINVRRVNRLGDVSVYDHGFSCYSVKGAGENGVGGILQKWYAASKTD
uniref:BPTI/Kunitz inhibitor domain-containing protein n=1 Tax=Plectus sambesii TaxID=2011161 RepID=A0A914W652_9BILA